MKYEFHVGDYVETKNDARGYVGDVDEMIWQCTQSSNDYAYVAGHTYCIPIVWYDSCFNRIGQYDFTKKDEDKIEPLACETASDYSNEKLRKKINELVEAVNRLEEKVNGMA